jgi:hypothetical protein
MKWRKKKKLWSSHSMYVAWLLNMIFFLNVCVAFTVFLLFVKLRYKEKWKII